MSLTRYSYCIVKAKPGDLSFGRLDLNYWIVDEMICEFLFFYPVKLVGRDRTLRMFWHLNRWLLEDSLFSQ